MVETVRRYLASPRLAQYRCPETSTTTTTTTNTCTTTTYCKGAVQVGPGQKYRSPKVSAPRGLGCGFHRPICLTTGHEGGIGRQGIRLCQTLVEFDAAYLYFASRKSKRDEIGKMPPCRDPHSSEETLVSTSGVCEKSFVAVCREVRR